MPEPRRIDWPTLRREYVEGAAVDPDGDPDRRTWPSLDELHRVHGVSLSRIKQRSSREHWTTLRERFQGELDEARRRRLIEQRATTAASIDRRALTNTEAGLALIGQRLTFLVQREQTAGNADRSMLGATVPAGELANLGLAARRWLQVKAAVLGQPSPDEVPDEAALERDLRVGEALLAARLQEHVHARDSDDGDLAETV